MQTPAIVQTLPYVAWTLLVSLAFGAMVFVVLTRQLSDATSGYLRFTAFSAGLLALLAWGIDTGLPRPADLAIAASSAQGDALRQMGLLLFALLCGVYGVLINRPRAALVAGSAALAVAVVTLAAAALGWAPAQPDAMPLAIQLGVLALATGGSMAAIVLGHWYLVTPRISERPLVLQSRLLMAVVALQVLLFVTWTTLGGGPGQTAFSAFTAGPLLLVVLRLTVTLLFPLVLVYMAWRTAQTRSMESATGLLYINLAAVMAGTIGAAAMYLSGGWLV